MARGKSISGLFLVWFLAMTGFASAQGREPGVTDSAVGIGILGPLSGSASSMGRNLLEGLQTFFDHVNDIGGVHGRSVVLLAHDDGDDPDRGVVAARRMFMEGKVFAIASTSGVLTTQALIHRGVLTDSIPALAGAALSKQLLSSLRKNVFFLGMPYDDQIVLALEYVLKKRPGGTPKMGLLSREGFLGEEVEEGFHRVCHHYGLQIVHEERYDQDTDDFGPFVNRLWAAGTDHLVLGATAWEATEIMREASRLGWVPQFIGPSSTIEPEILMEAGEGADNYLVVDYLARPWERAPGVALMTGLTEKYYPRKDARALHRYHILGYVSGLLVVEALQGAGRDLSRESFVHALESIHDLNTHGLTGVVGYDTHSRLANCAGRVLRFDTDSGILFPLTDWIRPMIKASE